MDVAAGLVAVGSLCVRLGHDQPMGQVHHQLAGVVGRPLAYDEAGDQFGILIQGGPKVHVAHVVALGLLLWGEPALLLPDERPDFVNLDMAEGEAA